MKSSIDYKEYSLIKGCLQSMTKEGISAMTGRSVPTIALIDASTSISEYKNLKRKPSTMPNTILDQILGEVREIKSLLTEDI